MLNQKKGTRSRLSYCQNARKKPKEELVNPMYILNAILRLEYWPKSLNIAQIMIPKPGKNPMDVSSY
jgi:hypothetical protein